MSKYRTPVWTDFRLRLQEVTSEREARRPQPLHPWPSTGSEDAHSTDPEEDAVVALTWPRESGWRYH